MFNKINWQANSLVMNNRHHRVNVNEYGIDSMASLLSIEIQLIFMMVIVYYDVMILMSVNS